MADTFPALLADLLRTDPGRPLVTFYDDATGERVELSVATYANWVAKASSLLVEEFDLERGDTLLLDLPTHWLGPVFLGAAWNAGLTVVWPGHEGPSAIACGPDSLGGYSPQAATIPVIASALLPMGVRFADPLPDDVHDFGAEVWSQPDSFIPWDPPTADDVALPGLTQRDLVTPTSGNVAELVAEGGRLLTTANPTSPAGFATFVAPLVNDGATVWVRNPDPGRLEQRVHEERATARWLV